MTILIAGCGDLGTEVGLRFAARGERVVGWRRSPGRLPAGIEGVAADLTRSLPPVPADTDVVVIATAAGARTEDAYRSAYVDATANVLDALERDGVVPRRILFVSSTAVYGDADGAWVTEDSPAENPAPTARLVKEAEDVLLGRTDRGTVLRLSGIYGPGRTRLIDQVTGGSAALPPQVQWTNRIHRDDAAAAIVHLVTEVPTPERIYLGSDELPVDLGEVLRFLAAELDLPEPPLADGSGGPARGGARRVDSGRLRSTGFSFTYPTYREGYRAVLAGKGVRHP
ncbi:NAD-dependent epimerase/dehydratase family protein [Arthrobacter agilis]|uniref:NAD(P)H-binding protein n=1 Tax=Arthrobacter agilis TaxID=37921 RepID=UPI000B35E5B9|nr:NAD(P)H-binding protein [Arthrobacter agilis]OUM40612.1 NAD(P)-dependent oxidoreductase [Arthrobacter agilis]PPB45223.1 NAD(P)-dependent oxidoreductase [Arthrobacter agilis]TPV27926.1 NAD-dependent epimerase/dehydratase family protein [Arthrobacter agilis]VDR31392.1 Putative NADH-flavin reductase [Arthrobacter agilis]